ncbi:hypothetical protein JCM5350_003129 [Sporobolomyces pararoseus]
MARPKRATTQKKINYTGEQTEDQEEEEEEQQMEVEGSLGSSHREASEDGEEPQEYEEEDEEEPEEFVPKKKKGRVSGTKGKGKGKGKVRGRAGKLQSMVDLPVDLWFQIAENLDPQSLLQMGRANKMMRSLFASKSNSQGLWNIVKRSVHLPELEATDFNDLALTNLIYDRDCHICGKGRAVLVDYALRKRWCKKCRSASLVLQRRLAGQVPNLTSYTAQCSLFSQHGPTNYNYSGKLYHYKGEAIEINEEILEYQRAILDADCKKEKKAAKLALEEYVAQRKVIVKAAFEDGKKLTIWEKSSAADRKNNDSAARQARQAAIKGKLLELGYEEKDIRYMYEASKYIDKPTALTPAIWNKISAPVIAVAEKNKQDRLAGEARRRREERRQSVKPYYDALYQAADDKKLFPPFSLFASLPSVQPFWKEEDSKIDEDIWHTALDSIKAQLPQVLRWIKLEYARTLLKAYEEAGHLIDQEIRSSIHPAQLSSAQLSEGYYGYAHETRLNIEDTSTISPSDLDLLLSRFTAVFKHGSSNQPVGWEQSYESSSETFTRGVSAYVSQNWLKTQLEVLKQTELEDNSETSSKLEKLGPKFDCYKCHDNIHNPFHYSWFAQSRQVVKPDKTTGLTWSEMFSHAFAHHREKYMTYNPSLTLRILYSDRKPGTIEEPQPEPAPTPAVIAQDQTENKEGTTAGDALVLDDNDEEDVKPFIEIDDSDNA